MGTTPSEGLRRATSAIIARPGRSALSSLGVAIGVGALVGVLGLASTVQAGLLAQLTRLGDVLTVVSNGAGVTGVSLIAGSVLPSVRRIPTVEAVAATRTLVSEATRSELIPADQTSGITVEVFGGDIAAANDARIVSQVRALQSTSDLPEVLVGWNAAQTLGVTPDLLPMSIWIGSQSVVAVGILGPTPTQSEVDSSVFLPAAYARSAMGFSGSFDTVYVRAPLAVSTTVASLLLPTVDPSGVLGLEVTQDSSALIAAADAATAFEGLTLALAGVGLLVAGLGVANILTIAVVERRAEIGIRRALGATRSSIAVLFVTEGALIALFGGLAGVVLGVWVTLIGGWLQGLPPTIPLGIPAVGFGVAILVALLASLYPALRAAMLAPNDALRTMA